MRNFVFTNDLLKEVKEAGLGIEISSGKNMGGMLFADDFVWVRSLLMLCIVNGAVMVFSKWGLPKVYNYRYLGIDFSNNGAWDEHIKR